MYPAISRQGNGHGFWDSIGIILMDYKHAVISITGEYYVNVIKQLWVATKEKRRGKLASEVLLLYAQVQSCTSSYSSSKIIRVSVQTWPKMIIICFEIWGSTCVERDFGTKTSSRMQQSLGLGTKQTIFISKAYNSK